MVYPFWLQLVLALFGHYFSTFNNKCLAKDHWRGFSTRNAHMVHIVNLIRLKWCIHLSRSLYLKLYISVEVSCYISTTWWVSLLVDQWVPEGTRSQVLRSTSVDSKRLKSIKIFRVKIDLYCYFVGLLHHPFWLQLLLALFGQNFQFFWTILFG